MKNLSREERLRAEYVNLIEIRDCCLTVERSLFEIVVTARKCGVNHLFRKSLQGVLFCLRSSIALMNNLIYSGRYSCINSSVSFHDSDELPY